MREEKRNVLFLTLGLKSVTNQDGQLADIDEGVLVGQGAVHRVDLGHTVSHQSDGIHSLLNNVACILCVGEVHVLQGYQP